MFGELSCRAPRSFYFFCPLLFGRLCSGAEARTVENASASVLRALAATGWNIDFGAKSINAESSLNWIKKFGSRNNEIFFLGSCNVLFFKARFRLDFQTMFFFFITFNNLSVVKKYFLYFFFAADICLIFFLLFRRSRRLCSGATDFIGLR